MRRLREEAAVERRYREQELGEMEGEGDKRDKTQVGRREREQET
jgi:hypothetical protein